MVLGLRKRNDFILGPCKIYISTYLYVCVCVYVCMCVYAQIYLPILDSFEEILPFFVLFGLPPFLSGSVFQLLLLLRIECVVRVTWGSGNQCCRQLADQRGLVGLQSARNALFLSQPFLTIRACPSPSAGTQALRPTEHSAGPSTRSYRSVTENWEELRSTDG